MAEKDKKEDPVCIGGDFKMVALYQFQFIPEFCLNFHKCKVVNKEPGGVIKTGFTPKDCPLLKEDKCGRATKFMSKQ